MTALIDFIQQIGSYITNLINSILQALILVADAVLYPTIIAGWVFPTLASCILIVASVSIVKLIIGWGNS